jgi:hypothetical protein
LIIVEGEVVVLPPHSQVSDLLLIGYLLIVGDQAYHCCVVGKLNYGVGVMPGRAVMSEQGVQEAPVLRIRVVAVLLPTLST